MSILAKTLERLGYGAVWTLMDSPTARFLRAGERLFPPEIVGAPMDAGTPLVRIRCGGCGTRVAVVEVDAAGRVVVARLAYRVGDDGEPVPGRHVLRFPGRVRADAIGCPDHGRLTVDIADVKAKARDAAETGETRTIRARTLR